jgi:ribosomal-protein-serine acetyltransferase
MPTNLQKALPHHAQHWYALLEQDRAWLEEWMPHLKEIKSLEQAMEYVQKNARSDFYLGEHLYEIWEAGQLVGLVSVHGGKITKQTVDMGYWLGRAYTGQGITAAACQLIFSKIFDSTAIQMVCIRCLSGNKASQAVSRKLGMSYLGEKQEGNDRILSFGMSRKLWMEQYFEEEDLFYFLEEEE